MQFKSTFFIKKIDLMQLRRVKYLMTYADNLALGYFKKQGFSK